MKKLLIIFAAVFALYACSESDDFIKCGEFEVKAEIHENSMTAVINGDTVVLPQVQSGSGARYEGVLNDTAVVMWNKGSEWTLIIGTESPISCE